MSTRHDDPLERYLDDFGRALQQAAAAPSPKRAPRRRITLLAGPVVAAALAISAVLLLLPGGTTPRRLDVIAEARAALQPQAGRLVHLVVRQHVLDPHRPGYHVTAPPVTTEQWSATNPVRWRMSWTQPSNVGRTSGQPIEVAYADGTEETYHPKSNRLRRVTGLGRQVAPAAYPLGTDPVATLRSLLASGRLRDAGTTVVAGRPLRRLTGTRSRSFGKGQRVTAPVAYYVDPTTYAPVRVRLGIPIPSKVPIVVILDFQRFEQLPLTDANAGLLKIHPKPGATVRVTRANQRDKPAKRTG